MTALVAALVDRWLGEPPAAVHPVVAMGRWLSPTGAWARSRRDRAMQFGAGATSWFAGAAAVAGLARAVDAACRRLPWPVAAGVRGAVLSSLWSWRLLDRGVGAVEQALSDGGVGADTCDLPPAGALEDARAAASRLVSRDLRGLDAVGLRQAALESLAENLSDSVVAPCWWYAVGGLPAAAVYRYANTADAMWGYRGDWEWAGKVAALADDLANLVPARLTAALLAATPATGAAPARRPYALRGEARRTPSPNAGWPMAALALRLDVRLEKRGVYLLHAGGREPTSADTRRARTLTRRAATAAFVGTTLTTLVRDLRRVAS